MIDFNERVAPPLENRDLHAEREAIRAELIANLESVLTTLYPAGKRRRNLFLIGDVLGSPGESLEVVLEGEKAGLWTDRAEGVGGDIYAMIAGYYHVDACVDFSRVLDLAVELLGRSRTQPTRKRSKSPPMDDLGPATAKWDYLDANGKLLGVVYRYDPPGRRKEFRPWDAKRRKMTPPEPRPLYNQPGIAQSEQVVLVEGEKCAQALIDAGICATTAMNGAKAPVDKTDWRPLTGKHVIIWPDRDAPGWAYADQASQAILRAGGLSVAILTPSEDKPEGWDSADALEEGFDAVGFISAGPRMPIEPSCDEEDSETLLSDVDWATEDGLAMAFTRRYGEDWRYCSLWGKWLVWSGMRWNSDQMLFVQHLVRGVCRAASQKADSDKRKGRLASAATIAAVEKIARSDPAHASTPEEWDADIWALNTPGGVVELRTGQIRAHRREDRMTKSTSATPKGDCPTWRTFLADVTGQDAELQEYLQRVVGYCLSGATSAHALFFLYGTGANGKSVFVNVVGAILGDYAANAPMDTFMEARGDRHPTDLAGLRGARFVSAIETEQGRRWNESKVKAITGGDKISARFMRQDFFEYAPQFKLLIAGNHKPAIRNVDEAMKRRLHLIPFTVTVPPEKRDGGLTDKLLAERGGILAWAVEGCLEWLRDGLKPPDCVRAATEEYFEAEDALGQWIEERCERIGQAKTASSELYADWREWAERAGEYVGSIKRFSETLITRDFMQSRLHGGTRGFKGLRLRPKPYQYSYYD
ncbi:predicted ATPase [Hahella chejuensis KCTC 2396]|uniref:Predicted ATPase n=2 Tax=Hahella chejuensis TaxID=158327 RepID=Q2SAI3_HAHCH|nr:predicted ATPase [Hahella chejuensis KCTC 2396]